MDCNIVMANQLNNDTKFSVDLVPINNILPSSLAGPASVDLVEVNNILPNSLAGTASVNLVPINNILPNSLAGTAAVDWCRSTTFCRKFWLKQPR